MTAHDVPFLWCVLQAALLSTLGIGAAWLFARRAPAAGATAATAAAAMIAVVTVLIPVRAPKVELWTPSYAGDAIGALAPATVTENPSASVPPSTGGLSFDVEDLAARLFTSIGASGMAEQEFGPLIETCVAGFFAFGAVVGTLRFMWSLCFVARLRRDREAIVDGEASRLFTESKARLKVAHSVELCESPRIASPAVIGWRRPIVLLPTERGDWSEDQLRATLAHELAHVVRGDFFWRFVAGATLAIHFFHPLVHLLTRRLTLMQELATDRLAASVAGGSTSYLRVLSELAIRLDDHSRLRAEPIALPALSSNLMRRIVMLRSKEGSTASRNHRLASAFAVGLIVLVGAGTMALRGSAEAVAPMAAGETARDKLFVRPPISPAVLSADQAGMFVVRPSELAKHPAFAAMFPMLNRMVRMEVNQIEGVDDLNSGTVFRLESIEYIAGTPQLTLRPKTAEQMGTFAVGCNELVVRFHEPVDLLGWFEDVMPLCKPTTVSGLTYVTLPLLPAMGPDPLLVAARDERTIVFADGLGQLRKLAARTRSTEEGVVARSWRALDGGAATFVARAGMKDSSLPESPGARMAVTVMLNTQQYGAAFDVDPATSQSQMRFVLTSTDLAAAEQVQAAVEGLLPIITSQLRAQIDIPFEAMEETPGSDKRVQTAGDANTERNVRDYWMTILESCTTRLEPQADGNVQVRIDAEAVLPQNVHVAYEYEVAEGAAEEASTQR